MGGIAVVLLMLAAGIAIGRSAGDSPAVHYFMAFVATVVICLSFLAWVMVMP